MKLLDILEGVGSAIISTTVPGGPLIVAGINALLPKDKQLPQTTTGATALSAIASLPPDARATILEKKYAVDFAKIKGSYDSLQVMLAANAQSKQTTRPKIAYQSFQIIAYSSIVAISSWSYAIVVKDSSMLKAVEESWPFILAVIAPLVTVLHAYFGVLTQESKDRLNSAQGLPVTPVLGLLSKLFKRS